MDLISLNSSWETINSSINSVTKEEISKTSYFNLKNLIFNNPVGRFCYLDYYDEQKGDSVEFLHSSSDQAINFVILGPPFKLRNSYAAIRDNDDGSLIFKIQPSDLDQVDIDDMSSIIENRIVVPVGAKSAYIQKFDSIGDMYNKWQRLTQEEKESKILEGDEYEAS